MHGAGILLQMQKKNRDEEPAERNSEEQETGDTWNLPVLWNKGLSNWQRLILYYFSQSKSIFNSFD